MKYKNLLKLAFLISMSSAASCWFFTFASAEEHVSKAQISMDIFVTVFLTFLTAWLGGTLSRLKD